MNGGKCSPTINRRPRQEKIILLLPKGGSWSITRYKESERIKKFRLHIWNPGSLPEELSIEELRKDHSSYPRNRNIANVFFKAGFIELWGRGINKIIEACIKAGLPEPVIKEEQGGLSIMFSKDIYTEEFFRKQNLEARQINALLYIKQHGTISNAQYQELTGVSKRTASRDFLELIEKGFIQKSGTTGKGTTYIFLQRKE